MILQDNIDSQTCAIGRVFVNEEGDHGNPVGVVLDEHRVHADAERTRITKRLGFSETVFVNSRDTKQLGIFTSTGEIAFAGHAAVGAASYLCDLLKIDTNTISGRDGSFHVFREKPLGLVWVESDLSSTPPWWHERVESAAELEALNSPMDPSQGHTQLWAWIDEQRDLVRARTFAGDWDIPEDEANGSGCMRLAAALGRELHVIHGRGSVIHAKPTRPGFAAVGGRVAWDRCVQISELHA
jgi:predicted PhzF superfamily epimerase YddE/YHI9